MSYHSVVSFLRLGCPQNQSKGIKIRKLTRTHHRHLIFGSHLSFTNSHSNIGYGIRSISESHIRFSCFFYPERLLNLFLTFMTPMLSQVAGQLYYRMPSVWVCLVFPHYLIHIICFWQEYYRSDIVFSVYGIRDGY